MKRCYGCMMEYEDEFSICPHCGYQEGTTAEESIFMEPGTVIQDRYTVGRAIGFGGFGVTYIGYDEVLDQDNTFDEKIYSNIRSKVEAKLWTGGMTQEEKLLIMIDYLNKTAHSTDYSFPELAYDENAINSTAKSILALQGGFVTDDNFIYDIAKKDLGMDIDVYYEDSDPIYEDDAAFAKKSKCYMLIHYNYDDGEYGPGSAWSEFVYKETQGTLNAAKFRKNLVTGITATGNQAKCSVHGCKKHVIPLK